MVAVPSLVSFFVWRDGWFVLHGTGVEVRSCDLLNVWLHFLVLMVIKPVSFWIARRILERKMALIESQAQNVQAAAQYKRQNLQGTVDVMNRKIMEMRAGAGSSSEGGGLPSKAGSERRGERCFSGV